VDRIWTAVQRRPPYPRAAAADDGAPGGVVVSLLADSDASGSSAHESAAGEPAEMRARLAS
jgi:hypothetical protein